MSTDLRQLAVVRLRKRRDLYRHALVYAMINLLLIIVWAFNGGFFWPIFLLIPWGVGLVMHAWDVYSPEQPTDARIEREIHRMTGR